MREVLESKIFWKNFREEGKVTVDPARKKEKVIMMGWGSKSSTHSLKVTLNLFLNYLKVVMSQQNLFLSMKDGTTGWSIDRFNYWRQFSNLWLERRWRMYQESDGNRQWYNQRGNFLTNLKSSPFLYRRTWLTLSALTNYRRKLLTSYQKELRGFIMILPSIQNSYLPKMYFLALRRLLLPVSS